MELRQLRYFISVIEHGSMGQAALELGVVTSALSQQISRLESELSTRLLQRTSSGVVPTDAGLAFWQAGPARAAPRRRRGARRAAGATVGPCQRGAGAEHTGVLGLPFMRAMRERYPDVRLRMVESLSGHLASMLGARQIDLAMLFQRTPRSAGA